MTPIKGRGSRKHFAFGSKKLHTKERNNYNEKKIYNIYSYDINLLFLFGHDS